MLDSLSTRLQSIFDRLGGRGRLTEENIQEALREVRVALLEADVNFKVVRAFVDRVREKAVGQDVLRSLTPAQQVVKVVHDELVELLGGSGHRLAPAPHPPTVILLIGLRALGRTPTAAKLARWYTKQGQHPLLAAADTHRPAAQEQLRTLGAQLDVPVVAAAGQTPLEICRQAREEAATRGLTPLILDTAGRLHIDEAMLEELVAIRKHVGPHHVLLVVDAMTGQDAVTVADHFNKAVGIDAVILTKLDGDARGGAALSVRSVTGRPIAFAGTGEKTDALEPFHPDRLASRILGMGDVLSPVERAQETIDEEEAMKAQAKLQQGKFDLDDFLSAMRQLRRMGPLRQVMEMMPGFNKLAAMPEMEEALEGDQMKHIEAMVLSMTREERHSPEIINGSRRKRIARGSGTTVQDINQLIEQFGEMRTMIRQMSTGKGKWAQLARQAGMGGVPGMQGMPAMPKP